jgi:large conductance mechanosensitive channel
MSDKKSLTQEFRDFISRGNVVDLAVGIIMGAAFTAIVTSLVQDVIMPPIGAILGGLDFSNYFLALKAGDYPTLKAAQDAGAPTLNYGLFINAIIKFVIVSFAVFWLVKAVNRIKKAEEAKPAAKPADVALLEEIRDLLKKG